MEYDIIIVGAGASGLVAAIAAARMGSKVIIIEQKEKAGKKLLATGNGKCNFTNLVQTPECYRSEDSTFAMKVLSNFDHHQTIAFFEKLGIVPRDRQGYLYPNSEQASSVVQVLLMECERLQVRLVYNERVTAVINKSLSDKSEQLNEQFQVTTQSQEESNHNSNYYARKLILCSGGCASPKLGSDGSGYVLAGKLGHGMIKSLPALVQLKSPDKYLKTISGVRTTGRVTAISKQRILAEEEGELVFTDYGISGIPVLQLSRFVAKALDLRADTYLTIDFLPQYSREEIVIKLKDRITQNVDKSLEQMLVGLFNNKLSYVMILQAKLDPYKKVKGLKEQEISQLVQQIKQFAMQINGTNSFDNAQVCTGGVPTYEVDPITLESNKCHNLYLCGELLDVDGTCGGYNLQWAWSTGFLAGSAAARQD
ncbi:MAG TPA: NAD(P)/FAD-dependent oxidoreductase [Mobilitalea sp.]|nr:NAD(P)/FAD-dependent oxidoreductase [Mobilitalea sp.]